MLRDTNFEHSSEARNFKFEANKDTDSILDQVEGMRDENVSEVPDSSADTGVDQAPEGLNGLVLDFRTKLESADLNNQSEINELNSLIDSVKEIDEAQAEALKEEFMNKKIE